MQIPQHIKNGLHGAMGGINGAAHSITVFTTTVCATGDEHAVNREMVRHGIEQMREYLNRVEAEFTKLGCLEAQAVEREDALSQFYAVPASRPSQEVMGRAAA